MEREKQEKQSKKQKKHRVLKIVGILAAGIFSIGIIGYFYLCFHPSIVINAIQNLLYAGKSANSYEPLFNDPDKVSIRLTKENGVYYVGDIQYADEYPNSFLDISYPNEDTSVDRPTIIYLHGGGFFGGSKSYGDPMAANDDATYLYDSMVLSGYNLVNIDYALVPEYHFPTPILQLNQAINYLILNENDLGLNMKKVVLMGGSAGAIMTAQYATAISNPEYAELYEFDEAPKLTRADLQAVFIDDAPIDIPNFDTMAIKIIIANYLDDSVFFLDKKKANWYNAINYLTKDFPPAFMTAGTDDGFPKDMAHFSKALTELKVDNVNFTTDEKTYGLTKHGYLSGLVNKTPEAVDCYEAMMKFIGNYTN